MAKVKIKIKIKPSTKVKIKPSSQRPLIIRRGFYAFNIR